MLKKKKLGDLMLPFFQDLLQVAVDPLLSRIRLFVTLWTVARQAPFSMAFPRQEPWNGLSFPSPRDLLDPGMEPMSPALAGRFFTLEPPGKVLIISYNN